MSSQNDTENKYVVLTEDQAKSVLKDLERYDGCVEENNILYERISIFVQKEFAFQSIIKAKDSIIRGKDIIITKKDEIINAKKPMEFHSYAGVRTFNIEWDNPIFYYKAQFELKKLNLGAQINLHPAAPDQELNGFRYNIYVEYKLF